ncbi:sigma-54-dependent transcriptional regulator [Oligoflexus tunisiensis]|uniref:sigma-54-dependent transcriptional regulator n=1 Tax=Oligoflexus tunisiensis TaxID=708132 RepID=UPI00114D045E|nr:sigma 54-interacting transcriptional regulator [Oligoflexus tunisiensis]
MTRRKPVILVVEDLGSELEKYLRFLHEFQFEALGARSLSDAMAIVSQQHVDLILTDLYLGADENNPTGLSLITQAREEAPRLPIVAMSLDPRVDIAIEARKRGAEQMIRKPIKTADELAIHVKRALEPQSMPLPAAWPQNLTPAQEAMRRKYPDGIVISEENLRFVELVANNPELVVCIYGETGTGKEEIARLIHRRRSARQNTPFISLNCANLQGELLLSTLFGHKKGAFTGALENSVGAIGQADGGILFLDEIHRLSGTAQEMLLRVLNNGSYQRVGDTKELKSSFQILIASTRNLDQEVENGSFLIDLRMRLIGLEINLPPLRERKDEMEDFIQLFFARQDKPVSLSPIESQKLTALCKKFHWQGNIRQLYKVLQVFVIMASMNNEPLQADRIPIYKTMHPPGEDGNSEALSAVDEAIGLLRACQREDHPLEHLVAAVEKVAISTALQRHTTIADACKALGISRSNIDLKRKKYLI